MDIHFVDRNAKGFLYMVADSVCDTGGNRFYPCAVLDDDIYIDVDLIIVIIDFDSVGGIFDDAVGETFDDVLRGQADYTV